VSFPRRPDRELRKLFEQRLNSRIERHMPSGQSMILAVTPWAMQEQCKLIVSELRSSRRGPMRLAEISSRMARSARHTLGAR